MSDLRPPEGEGYDLQAVYAEVNKPFWFRWADRWWMIPHLKMLDFEVQAAFESFDFDSITGGEDGTDLERGKDRLNDLFDLIMGEEQGVEWRKVSRPFNFLIDLLNRWTEHSGAKQGEGSASDGSSKSTGRPSKRTSTGTTASASRKSSPAKKAPAKRASRKAARPSAADLAAKVDEEWLARHQELAATPPENS